ncbi:MAG: fumarylacetoacetate hydrolase family protein [Caldilineaceae bacterium]|nr:fumarylacetoacetate hydrolase family protein [Caldilineaceae bacterium]
MRLATYFDQQQLLVGAVVGDQIYDLAAALQASGKGDAALATSVVTLLTGGQAALDQANAAIAWAQAQGAPVGKPLSSVKLAAPIPCPGKLLCLAGNYASHIEEGGGKFAGKEKMIPRFFIKPCDTVIGTGGAIRIPPSTGFADWELELAVVIGKTGRDLTAEQAGDYIAGYTIFNDISARNLAFRQQLPQMEGDWFFDWLVGKWLDTFGPMGPWITTADEVPHPDNLRMQLWYNGELQQDANTGQMVFSPAEAIAFISQFVTLNPGDIISTGTPAGVGQTKKLRLNPGDQIRGEIELLGVLENSVEQY